jgi:Flp pilus assembly protein TadG
MVKQILNVLRPVRRLLVEQAGSTLVTFGLAAPALFLFVALTLEYGYLLRLRMRLDAAADTAALAAVSAANTYIANYAGTGDPFAKAVKLGEAQAVGMFNANAGALGVVSATPTATLTRSGSALSASVSYTFSTSNLFAPNLFQRAAHVTRTSVASMGGAPQNHVNIIVVIDNSESMGIGATEADQQIIYSKNGGCAFACHYLDKDTAPEMRALGATLRIDAEKAAVDAALATLPTNATYRAAIYTMAENLARVAPLTSDIATLRQKVAPVAQNASSVDLAEDVGLGGNGSTDFAGVMAQLRAELSGMIASGQMAAPGDGSSAQKAQGLVILVTDGIQNSFGNAKFTFYSPCAAPTCNDYVPGLARVQSLSSADCAGIKALGFRLMTLHADYLVPDQTKMPDATGHKGAFDAIQGYVAAQSRSALAACASSPSDAFSASSPQQLADAVQSMVGAVARKSRLKLTR